MSKNTSGQPFLSKVTDALIYYHRGASRYLYWDVGIKRLFNLSRTQLKSRLAQRGYNPKREDGELVSECDAALIAIEKNAWVDEVDDMSDAPHERFETKHGGFKLIAGEKI